MRIVYMGTPDFAVPPLRKLYEAGHEIAGVFTQPDRPKGRSKRLIPSDVKVAAEELGIKARAAETAIAAASSALKDKALSAIAQALISEQAVIISENAKDLAAAKENGMSESMQDRLRLDEKRIAGMAEGVRELIAMTDPIGQVVDGFTRPNGLRIIKVRAPLGVIGIIFESRPNVTVDARRL